MRGGELLWGQAPIKMLANEQMVNIRCGACLGCDTATQRDWALRCFHEALSNQADWTDVTTNVTTKLPNSCVITLTYSPQHLPSDQALHHEDFQNFMKRVRIWQTRSHEALVNPPPPIRFFMCGEYGLLGRPHFHSILYGITFENRYPTIDKAGQTQVHSEDLDALWGKGRATIDEFSFAGASYVAGYVAKKSQVPHRGPTIDTVDTSTGLFLKDVPYKPEYRKMSMRLPKPQAGGLGGNWALQNLAAIYKNDLCQMSEWKFRPPRYYDTLLSRIDKKLSDKIKIQRQDKMGEHANEWTPERCTAAEQVEISKLRSRSESLD